MEVLAVRDVDSASLKIMTDEMRCEKAEEVKKLANEAFREQRFDEALVLYKEASMYVGKLSMYTSET